MCFREEKNEIYQKGKYGSPAMELEHVSERKNQIY
jgi:hypothetical protein